MAVLLSAVVLALNASEPRTVFEDPVVFAPKALYPTTALLLPVV